MSRLGLGLVQIVDGYLKLSWERIDEAAGRGRYDVRCRYQAKLKGTHRLVMGGGEVTLRVAVIFHPCELLALL